MINKKACKDFQRDFKVKRQHSDWSVAEVSFKTHSSLASLHSDKGNTVQNLFAMCKRLIRCIITHARYSCVFQNYVDKYNIIDIAHMAALWNTESWEILAYTVVPLCTTVSFQCTWAAGSSLVVLYSWAPTSYRRHSQSPWRCPLLLAP